MKTEVCELTASPAAELRERNRVLVTTIALAYKEAKELPIICASSYDPAPVTRSKKWTPEVCHFTVDVENASRRLRTSRTLMHCSRPGVDCKRTMQSSARMDRDSSSWQPRSSAPEDSTRQPTFGSSVGEVHRGE